MENVNGVYEDSQLTFYMDTQVIVDKLIASLTHLSNALILHFELPNLSYIDLGSAINLKVLDSKHIVLKKCKFNTEQIKTLKLNSVDTGRNGEDLTTLIKESTELKTLELHNVVIILQAEDMEKLPLKNITFIDVPNISCLYSRYLMRFVQNLEIKDCVK